MNFQEVHTLLDNLLSPKMSLVQVKPEYIEQYLNIFKIAKEEKSQAAINRSLNESYEPDMYDNLLNQIEIQGYIRKVNSELNSNK